MTEGGSDGGRPHLMDMIRFFMASVRALEWEASSCHVGGSFGFMARLLAEVRRLLDDLMTLRPAW